MDSSECGKGLTKVIVGGSGQVRIPQNRANRIVVLLITRCLRCMELAGYAQRSKLFCISYAHASCPFSISLELPIPVLSVLVIHYL